MEATKNVKHEGCYECGSKDQETLTSVAIKGQGTVGWALCDQCLNKHEKIGDIRE